MISIESGTDTVVQQCGDADVHASRVEHRRLHDPAHQAARGARRRQHTITPVNVNVAILIDGLADVVSIGGVAVTPASYEVVGGDVPSLRFLGNVTVSGGNTITRANGSELGSFVEEGFQIGQRIRTSLTGTRSVHDPDTSPTTTSRCPAACCRTARYTGVAHQHAHALRASGTARATSSQAPQVDAFGDWQGWTSSAPTGGWLADGFLEGQWVEICDGATRCGRFKIQVIRGTNPTKDNKLELRYIERRRRRTRSRTAWPVRQRPLLGHPDRRRRPLQRHQLVQGAEDRAPGRRQLRRPDQPATASRSSRSRPTGSGSCRARSPSRAASPAPTARSTSALKLPGEADGPLFKIGTQPPESKQIDVLNMFNDGPSRTAKAR